MELHIYIDPDINAYEGFYDLEWVRDILKLTDGTKLSEEIFKLCATWKGLSNARRLPWLMMNNTKTLMDSLAEWYLSVPERILELTADKIARETEKELQYVNRRIRGVIYSQLTKAQSELIPQFQQERASLFVNDLNTLWENFITTETITLALWMSERNTYAGVYFAYESFLVNSLKRAYNKQRLQANRLHKFFDEPVVINSMLALNVKDQCWNDPAIEKARLIRNAMTHNGGKVTGELGSKYGKELHLTKDKEIVIKASDTTELYHLLKTKVLLFSEEILKLPSMQ